MGGRTLPRAQPTTVAKRGMALGPRTLSLRMDGLFTQCCVAAIIFFVPQDLVFCAGLFAYWHNMASSISPCKKHQNVDDAIEEFKAKKGLEKVSVSGKIGGKYVTIE